MPQPLTQDQKDRKLRAVDKLRAQVRKMQPFINRSERLRSGAWDAFVNDRRPSFIGGLQAFRDDFDKTLRELDALRDQYPEYDDAVAATRIPNRQKWVGTIDDYLMVSDDLATWLKDGAPKDVYVRLASDGAIPFEKFVMEYMHWHGAALANVDCICWHVAQ